MRDPAKYAVLVGLLLAVASVTFLWWSLVGYSVTATQIDAPPEDATQVDGETIRTQQTENAIVAYEELDEASKRLVREAVTSDGSVTVYGSWYTHQTPDGDLPAVIEDAWLESYDLGTYVAYEGTYYEVTAPVHGEPIFLPLIVLPGGLAGLVVAGVGALVRRRGGPAVAAHAASAVGLVLLIVLAWFGNVHSYV